jgi:hypothetical protein
MSLNAKLLKFLLIIPALCLASEESVKSGFWMDKTQRIGVGVEYCSDSPGIYSESYKGRIIANYEHTANVTELTTYIRNLDISRFLSIKDAFVKKLNQAGYQVKAIPYLLRPKWIEPASEDYSEIVRKEGVDALLVFSVNKIGVLKEYDRNGGLDGTYAVFDVHANLKNAKKGRFIIGWTWFDKRLWSIDVPRNESHIELNGDWNQPPHFPQLTFKLNQAIDNAKKFLMTSFFQQ